LLDVILKQQLIGLASVTETAPRCVWFRKVLNYAYRHIKSQNACRIARYKCVYCLCTVYFVSNFSWFL